MDLARGLSAAGIRNVRDIRYHPERDPCSTGPSQSRAMQDRRIGNRIVVHLLLTFSLTGPFRTLT